MILLLSPRKVVSALQQRADRPPPSSPSKYESRLLNRWLFDLIADRLRHRITDEDTAVFFEATKGLIRRHGRQFRNGMTDIELTRALEALFGIWGGSGGPQQVDVSHQAHGLKIWADFCPAGKPLFAGEATLRMARHLYGIPNPTSSQLSMF
jgi:hypothetical protein